MTAQRGDSAREFAVPADMAERLPVAEPAWWCWRCGWWKREMPGTYRPEECGECASWSRERRLPTETLQRVLVTLEATP